LSSLSATTPGPSTPQGSITHEAPRAKKRKLTFAEKQEEERQKILKKARREEERNVKNEERRVKNEAKEVKKREKDLEKQVKEDEKKRKEEEIEKKERVSLQTQRQLDHGRTESANCTMTGSITNDGILHKAQASVQTIANYGFHSRTQ